MTDVLMFNAPDGGEILVENGVVALSDGLETAAYLALFGGNSDDSGDAAESPLQWWGNHDELNPARKYRSRFQYLMFRLPPITSNLLRLEEAALADLQPTFEGVATNISVRCSMPAINRIAVTINFEIDGAVNTFTFTEDWGANT